MAEYRIIVVCSRIGAVDRTVAEDVAEDWASDKRRGERVRGERDGFYD